MSSDSTLLDKSYDTRKIESDWGKRWEQAEAFKADSNAVLSGKKKPYVVMMPPPNVTGVLHNGHALFVTLEDILVRYHRMLGEESLWLPGVDHAGIATQAVVERQIKQSGRDRLAMGREAFLEEVWSWKEKNGDRIVEQLKLLGASADWSRLRFTMDEICSNAVKKAFVDLWNDGLIYRGERLVNWDPGSHTALSNEEVDHEERDGLLFHFAYKLKADDSKEIVVATTRPETMLGDTAIAVHPSDDRYKSLVGHEVIHPYFPERKITVVADDYVDKDFGSGAVKITPAHDPNDFEIGSRHNLEIINIFTHDNKVNENGGPFAKLAIADARKQVKQDLQKKGLTRGEENIKHAVSISQRSGEVIEPMLSRQYFLNTQDMARSAYEAVEKQETRIIPKAWKKTWDNFMLNPKDWCISRQLWWGHRIPVFYDVTKLKKLLLDRGHGEAYDAFCQKRSTQEILSLALNELSEKEVRAISEASIEDLSNQGHSGQYVQEEDVLDTWFSSGLWPFSTLGWPNNTNDLKAFYPGAVLETGFDILFFWVARMMMFGIHFMGEVPFKDIYLHAMVRDSHGKKMSKSLGNAIDPIDVVDGISLENLQEKIKTYPVPPKLLPKVLKGVEKEYPEGIPASGADGLRLSLAILSGQGRDVKLAIPRVAGYRAFLNKVWNATRFALMRIENPSPKLGAVEQYGLAEKWILSRLNRAIQSTHAHLAAYRFDLAADGIYQFFWSEFCDWYIEFSKLTFDKGTKQERSNASTVILHTLDSSMRLLHPFCPYISEEIWQKLQEIKGIQSPGFCAKSAFPREDIALFDETSEDKMALLQEVIVGIRNLRQESGLSARKPVLAYIKTENENISENIALLESVASLKQASIMDSSSVLPSQVVSLKRPEFELHIDLEGLVDPKKERERIEREIAKLEKEYVGLNARLSQESFVDKAPEPVVKAAKKRHGELQSEIKSLKNEFSKWQIK